MDRFDIRSIGAVAGITLISAILTFKFEWYFITTNSGGTLSSCGYPI